MVACDKLDGLEDGEVSHVGACKFDAKFVAVPGGADTGDTCLSDAQIDAFDAYNS